MTLLSWLFLVLQAALVYVWIRFAVFYVKDRRVHRLIELTEFVFFRSYSQLNSGQQSRAAHVLRGLQKLYDGALSEYKRVRQNASVVDLKDAIRTGRSLAILLRRVEDDQGGTDEFSVLFEKFYFTAISIFGMPLPVSSNPSPKKQSKEPKAIEGEDDDMDHHRKEVPHV